MSDFVTREFEREAYGYFVEDNGWYYDFRNNVCKKKNSLIRTSMHYTDPQARKGAVTVWGEKEEGLHYVYSDRLSQWDSKKWDMAMSTADRKSTQRTPEFYEIALSWFFDKEVQIGHIMLGCNLATGYDYLIFGYKDK